jgi:hypothetical protein
MKRYLTVGIIFGVLVVIVVAISWFAFPAWQTPASGGFWTLLGLTLVGVLAFLQSAVSIWKDLKEEKKEEQKPSAPMQSIDSQKADAIYNAPGGIINVVQQMAKSTEPTPETPSFWHLAHPYPMPPNFTGRLTERSVLTRWLNEDTEYHLFIIRALGGFGKSALSWHWLTHDVDSKQWTKVLWWSFYEGDASFENFITETLKYLKLEIPQGQRPQVDELLKAMQGGRILLIMDGFERALRAYSSMSAAYQGDEEPKLEDNQLDCVNISAEIFLKSVCSLPNIKSKVLMTTRLTPRAVKPRGEFMLGCLEEELTAMQKEDAVLFFRKQKIKGTHAEIESACEPYGYHPLSLRILAGLIIDDRKTPGDISVANKLEITDDIIQNKHHVLEVAYNTLSPEQQKLLSTIACFRSPMNYEALKEISSKPLGKGKKAKAGSIGKLDDNLKTLETRGLLHWDRKTNKYDLHPIVRRYAYERLTAPDRTGAHKRLRDYFAAVDVPKQVKSLDELAPVVELYHHTVQAGELDKARQLFYDRINYPTFYQLGAYQLRIELLRALFLDGENNLPSLTSEDDQAWTLTALANSYYASGQPLRSVPLFQEQNKLQEKNARKNNLARGLINLGVGQRFIGALSEAETNLLNGIELSKEIADKFVEAACHQELGLQLSYRGIQEQSQNELISAMREFEQQNHLLGQSQNWSYKVMFALIAKDKSISNNAIFDYLMHSQQKANEWAQSEFPAEREFIRIYWLLGVAYDLDNQLDFADQNLAEALTRCRTINLVEMESNILLDLAHLRYDQEKYEDAKNLAEEALSITERCGYVLQGADVNLFLAQYTLEQEKDKVKAKEYAQTALKLAYCDGPPYYYKVAYEEAERMLEGLNQM